jgi:hypothetical protein
MKNDRHYSMIEYKLFNDTIDYGLGFNSNINTAFALKMFPGAIYDSNQMKIYVQIYDNDGAFTIYDLPQFITVRPDTRNLSTTINNLIRKEPTDKLNIILNEGFLIESTQEIQRISSLLNVQSLSDKFGLILSKNAPLYPQVYGQLMNFSGLIQVNN